VCCAVLGVAVSGTTKPGVEKISLLAEIALKFISQGQSKRLFLAKGVC